MQRGPSYFAFHILFVVCGFLVRHALSNRITPIIRWKQTPGSILLSVMVNAKEESVIFNSRGVEIKGSKKNVMDGEFHLHLSFLRPIDAEGSNYDKKESFIKIRVKKQKIEPCWIRLLKDKKNPPFLKRDGNASELCQKAKETWRAAYLWRKYHKKGVEWKQQGAKKIILENEWARWNLLEKIFRDRAIPLAELEMSQDREM